MANIFFCSLKMNYEITIIMNYINSQVMVDEILSSIINWNCEDDKEVFLLSLENITSSQMEARSRIINIQTNKSKYK